MDICASQECLRPVKREPGALGLELQTVGSHSVEAENRTWILCKNIKCS